MIWTDIGAVWRGPVLAHSGTISDHMYVVIHTADGSFEGTIAWQKNPQAGNSSHFVVAKDGRIAQVNDTANRSGAQKAGNPYSIAIENEGFETQPLTNAQIQANAKILAKAHMVHGVPLQLTGIVGRRGLGHHSMGAESGVDWGHSACPGGIIKSQKPTILSLATQMASAGSFAVGGNQDMDFNQATKLDGVFNLYPTVKLDTNLGVGTPALAPFPVPITGRFNALEAKVDLLLKMAGVAQVDIDDIQARTGSVTLTQADLDAISAATGHTPEQLIGYAKAGYQAATDDNPAT